jgi:xanthine dehydrogenase accessory factor
MRDGDQSPDWLSDGPDDMLPIVAALTASDTPFALVTLHAADGGPRPVGSQMVVTAQRFWGFLSGGCVEADVARHTRAALMEGAPRRLTYGLGSPFFDIRLPCGGRIDLLIEPIPPGDPAMHALIEAARERRAVQYLSNGARRKVSGVDAILGGGWIVRRLQEPRQRLAVVGGDPFALAIAGAGLQQGWEVTLIRPLGPSAPPPLAVTYSTAAPEAALAALVPDPWTAIAVVTHDADLDQEALFAALNSAAGYVGVLGSRRRLEQRKGRLLGAGLPSSALARLRAPIGLAIAARSPREIAVAVVAEIIERRPAVPGAGVPRASAAAAAAGEAT